MSVEYNTDNETITLESEADTDDADDADNALPASELAGKENKITKMKTFGVWAHYWDGKIRKVPKTFQFPKGKPLLSVFLDWHLPNIDKKHPPLHALDSYDVANVNRGTQRLSELKLVMNTFITFIKQEASAKIRKLYEGGKKNLSILTEVFDACKHLYLQEKPTRRIEQMSWESFVTESRNWKLRGYPTITHKPKPPKKPRAPRVSRTTTSPTASTKKTTTKKTTTTTNAPKRKVATTISSQRKKNAHLLLHHKQNTNQNLLLVMQLLQQQGLEEGLEKILLVLRRLLHHSLIRLLRQLRAPWQGLLVHLFVQLKKLQGYVVQVQIRLRLLSVLSAA